MLSWRGVALVQEARLGNSTVGPANRKSIFAAHTGAISLYGSIAHSRSDPRLAAGGTRLMADARRIPSDLLSQSSISILALRFIIPIRRISSRPRPFAVSCWVPRCYSRRLPGLEDRWSLFTTNGCLKLNSCCEGCQVLELSR